MARKVTSQQSSDDPTALQGTGEIPGDGLFLLAGAGTAPLNFANLVEFCLVNDEKTCCSVDDALGFKGGFGGVGWGGLMTFVVDCKPRCCLVDDEQNMLFGGWCIWFQRGGSGGVGGLMTFVVDCKPRWCCLVDDEQNMLFGGWCTWFQRGGSGGGG